MAAKLVLAALVLAPAGAAQDARKWAEAAGFFQKMSASKDASDRARAASELGNATGEKYDKACWQMVSGLLRQELGRENQGKNEERVSGDVLEACVGAFRKISNKDVLAEMAKVAKNKGEGPRVRVYVVYGLAPAADLKDLTELADDRFFHVQIAALDALAERADKSSADTFLKVIRDEKRPWEAKLAALKGLEQTGDEKCVDALIEGLGKVKGDEGRLKDEYVRILKKLVGVDLNTDDPNGWKAAWTAKKEGQDAKPAEGQTVAEPVEFFGLKTKSTRIIFVLDRTGSMAVPLKAPPPMKKPDPPKKGPEVATGGKKESREEAAARAEAEKLKRKVDERPVQTRMDALKKEFINTIWNLNEKVWFGVIWYEGNPQPWKEQLLPATWPNKLEIIRETEKLQPSGPTNIWSGLETAYKMVEMPHRPDVMQMDKKGNYATMLAGADTFYLMTDGAHNTGKFVNEKATTPLDVCDVPAFVGELRKVNKLRKVIVNAICLGSEAPTPDLLPDPKLMQKIAEETGGEFVHVKG
jgi:HEAT repeat protein